MVTCLLHKKVCKVTVWILIIVNKRKNIKNLNFGCFLLFGRCFCFCFYCFFYSLNLSPLINVWWLLYHISHVSSGILIPVYRYECPYSGAEKIRLLQVELLFIISSSNHELFYFWHQGKLFVAGNWGYFYFLVL